jgi:hypothetical protein
VLGKLEEVFLLWQSFQILSSCNHTVNIFASCYWEENYSIWADCHRVCREKLGVIGRSIWIDNNVSC